MLHPNSPFPGRVRRFRPFTNLSEGTPCLVTGREGGALVRDRSERPVPCTIRSDEGGTAGSVARGRGFLSVGGSKWNYFCPLFDRYPASASAFHLPRNPSHQPRGDIAKSDQAVCSAPCDPLHVPDDDVELVPRGGISFPPERKADGLHR